MSRIQDAAVPADPEVRKFDEWQPTSNGRLMVRHKPDEAPEETPIDVIADPVDRMITTRQAAVILCVSDDTLKKWRVRKRGPRHFRYHDGAIRYSLSDIQDYLDKHMVEN